MDLVSAKPHSGETLGTTFLRNVRRGPTRLAVVDAGGELSRLRLAGAALALPPALGLAPGERRVGVLLPAGRGGALVNVALVLDGRLAVNLNHTVGNALMATMMEMAGIRTVITARAYVDRLPDVQLPAGTSVIYAEDLLAALPKARVAWQMLRALVRPLHRLDRGQRDEVATLIFSSGSTGTPKGVQHTHAQVIANIDAICQHLQLRFDEEILLSPLPLFHAFGLLPGLWLGLGLGFTVAAHPDPRDGAGIGRLAERAKATFLISTPTFVRAYMRRITPQQLTTLRFAFVGAEKCPEDLKVKFEAQYGSRLLEGYGSTEMGPAVAVNTPTDSRPGTVGRPLPGVEVLTMDPETFQLLKPGEQGLLVVRSAARMKAYLDRPDLTQAAFIHDGYNMGDLGWVDEEGFVHVAGRLARFAKLGGEMVPLDTVEEALQAYLAAHYAGHAAEVAVAAVPDDLKGERLVVLHTALPCSAVELLDAVHELPPIFRPRERDLYEVAGLPTLGTGKRDLGALKRLAEAMARGDEQEPEERP